MEMDEMNGIPQATTQHELELQQQLIDIMQVRWTNLLVY